MNYKIVDLTAPELLLIGEALDLLPHGKVQKLVVKMQAQITEQDFKAASVNAAFHDERQVTIGERTTVSLKKLKRKK